jgi:hypothetical protein
MRLLDRVAHSAASLRLALTGRADTEFDVTAAGQFAASVASCPLRFVLGDDLTRASAQLAFADGARLAGCLDLLRVPATRLWVEWNDDVHQSVIHETGSATDYNTGALGRSVGVLLRGTSDGLRAVARTFWSNADSNDPEVTISPIETHIDLRCQFAEASDIEHVLSGGLAKISDTRDQAISALLDCVRFRFDDEWAAYYRAAAGDPGIRSQIVRGSLAAVARDPPLLLAFFLLLSANNATRSIPVSRSVINRKRSARGRANLLDHIEVHTSLDIHPPASDHEAPGAVRRPPRLHHVRGHLVRRDNRIFWRTQHLRGSASQGSVRSRTVCLSFTRPHPSTARDDSPANQSHI